MSAYKILHVVIIVYCLLGPVGSAAAAGAEDVWANRFLLRCSGCHTIGKGVLTGPDLAPTAGWPEESLRKAIVNMEKNVGALPPAEVDGLLGFLKDAAARDR